MKRYRDLWDSIIDIDNIKLAHENAKKGKSHYREVKMVEGDLDKYCLSIQEMLKDGFSTSGYRVEDIWDGNKYRTIHKLPYYPDRIVQHALMNIVGAIFYPTLIRDTFQSIPNRGTGDAVKRVRGCLDNTSPSYALKVDVHKFYPSVDNGVMKEVIRRKIKCKKTLMLFDDIIDSTVGLPTHPRYLAISTYLQ